MKKPFLTICILGVFLFVSTSLQAKEWDPQLLQATRLIYQGSVGQAEKTIETYLQEHPEDPNGLMVKATLLDWKAALTGQPEREADLQIIKVYEEANQLAFQRWYRDPENIDKMIDLGNSYLFLGRKYTDVGSWLKAVLTSKKCQTHLEKALKLDPSRVDGLLSLGGFHYFAATAPSGLAVFKKLFGIRGSKEEGLAELRRAATGNHPYVLNAQYALIYVYMDYEKNYEEALKVLENLETQFPENTSIRYKRPMIYEKQDRAKGREGFLNFARWCESKKEKCHPSYLFLAYYHAGRLSKDLGQAPKAKEWFAKAIMNNTSLYPIQAAEALYWSGLIEEAEGNFTLAIERYQQARSVRDIPDKLRKEIKQTLEKACQTESKSDKC